MDGNESGGPVQAEPVGRARSLPGGFPKNRTRLAPSHVIMILTTALIIAAPGCSGSSTRAPSVGGNSDAVTGTFDDWVAAVCQPGYDAPSSYNPVIKCIGPLPDSRGLPIPVMVFDYATKAAMNADRQRWQGGFGSTICLGANGDIGVFRPQVSGTSSRSAATDLAEQSLMPLSDFGCRFTPPGPLSQPPTTAPERIPGAPSTSTPPVPDEAAQLPASSYGNVYVQTQSGRVRCMIEEIEVICETPESNWPAHGVKISDNGSTEFANGNLGDIQPTTMGYQTYRAKGWTIVAFSVGTRFTNDRTGHGAVVSAERVDAF